MSYKKDILHYRLIGILLIFCLITPVGTSYLVLKNQKKKIKREVKWRMIAGINEDELVLLKFTDEEKRTLLKWKHSKEFEYQGEMYDIVKSITKRDTTYYWLWWDHEETKLNQQLTALVSMALGKNHKNNENKNRLLHFLKSLFCIEIEEIKITVLAKLYIPHFYALIIYQSIVGSPAIPPPKINSVFA